MWTTRRSALPSVRSATTVGAVVHNAATPELWRRTMIYAQRHLAAVLGISQSKAAKVLVLSFCRVAEFQRRGVVHLHAVVRMDGADGAPPRLEADELARACLDGARSVSLVTPRGCAYWGAQIDVQVLGEGDDRVGRVASYLGKYATKSSSEDPRLDARILSIGDLEAPICRRTSMPWWRRHSSSTLTRRCST